MKWLERVSKKAAKSASTAVKEEVKNTAIDLLPTVIGFGGLAFGIWVFRNHVETGDDEPTNSMMPQLPAYRTINITTNNYYIGKEFENENKD